MTRWTILDHKQAFFSPVFRPQFKYWTIWQPDTNLPFVYQASSVIKMVTVFVSFVFHKRAKSALDPQQMNNKDLGRIRYEGTNMLFSNADIIATTLTRWLAYFCIGGIWIQNSKMVEISLFCNWFAYQMTSEYWTKFLYVIVMWPFNTGHNDLVFGIWFKNWTKTGPKNGH